MRAEVKKQAEESLPALVARGSKGRHVQAAGAEDQERLQLQSRTKGGRTAPALWLKVENSPPGAETALPRQPQRGSRNQSCRLGEIPEQSQELSKWACFDLKQVEKCGAVEGDASRRLGEGRLYKERDEKESRKSETGGGGRGKGLCFLFSSEPDSRGSTVS